MNIFENGFQINWEVLSEYLLQVLVQAGLLLILFAIIKPIGKKVIHRLISNYGKHQKLTEGRQKTLEKLLINVFTYLLSFFLIITLLGILNIPIGPFLAGAGIIGLAISFGAQGLVNDVVTGFFILLEHQIDVDDYVTTAGYDGVVEEVGFRTTKIRGFDGTLHFIPNRNISGVSNHSRGNMRALVDIGISYDENIDQAIEVLQKVCDDFSQNDTRMKEGPNVLGVQSLGSSDVVLRIIGKTGNMEQWAVERDLRRKMKEALDQAGIEIPYPHQVYIEKENK
ncbi:mechanosensitive ion channel family protein [Bacillaceae bacterium S4-13-58]